MLTNIETYLEERLTPERTAIYIDSLRLIHSYEVMSPIESINEVITLVDTYSNEEAIGLIESIITNAFQEILANFYIICGGDLLERLTLLKALNLVEHFIDSDVIVHEYDEELSPQEMLLKFISIVSNKPIEYFDSFIMNVRSTLIELIVKNHQDQVDASVANKDDGIEISKLELVKAFAEKHPDALGVQLVKNGVINLDMDLTLLVNLTRQDIYKMTSPNQIAKAIYSIVLVSKTDHMSVPKATMDVVNVLFDDIMLIGELKYLVTSFD